MEETIAAQREAAHILRPICFMIMPYGKKPTASDKGPATINYDALWDKALFPLINTDLNYNAIRADQDLGAMIIKEMIERLTMADLVIADVSTPNPNVYYEIGVRHASKETGCVMISADWSRQTFDIDQMRQVRYPLPEGEISDDTAAAVREKLKGSINPLIAGKSPVYDCLPGYPGKLDESRASSFRNQMEDLSKFSTEVRAIRLLPDGERVEPIQHLTAKYADVANKLPAVALEIIYLLRDSVQWRATTDFIKQLPEYVKNLPVVKEQGCLAQSKSGNTIEAIAALEELIKVHGDSSERRGLLGGRFKSLYRETKDPSHLNRSIAEYDKGMRLDLNNYYPSSNLPRLYLIRNRAGDKEKAKAAATVTLMACERSAKMNTGDQWVLPTLLGAAFNSGNVDEAQRIFEEMDSTGPEPFKLQTTIPDLEASLSIIQQEDIKEQLTSILEEIKKLQKSKESSEGN